MIKKLELHLNLFYCVEHVVVVVVVVVALHVLSNKYRI